MTAAESCVAETPQMTIMTQILVYIANLHSNVAGICNDLTNPRRFYHIIVSHTHVTVRRVCSGVRFHSRNCTPFANPAIRVPRAQSTID